MHELLDIYLHLRDEVQSLAFAPPVAVVYNPLDYAWRPFEDYVRRYSCERPRALFLGMNPGPFGMVQTGVPFGDPVFVREWMGISSAVAQPERSHPKRPVLGLESPRREVSGTRLWGLFRDRFGFAEAFFSRHVVANYCPLAFLGETGRNITPDKLPAAERSALFAACDGALARVIGRLRPDFVVGIGRFAETRLAAVDPQQQYAGRRIRILHPSPASPAANRGWAAAVTKTLKDAAVWPTQGGGADADQSGP